MLPRVSSFALLSSVVGAVLPGPGAAQSTTERGDRIEAAARRERARDHQLSPVADAAASPLPLAGPGAAAGSSGVLVGAVRIEGASALSVAVFAPAIERYMGRPLGPAELRQLAGDVAQVARDAGYGLATARVPQQTVVNGVLRVSVDEGRIDAIEVSGDGKAAVEPLLGRLVTGKPVRTRDLERQLLLAADAAGVTTSGARVEERNGRRVLVIKAARRAGGGRLTVDNWGSKEVGPVIATLSYDFNGLVSVGDELSISGSTTPQVREFAAISASYTKKLNSHGTEASIGASWFRVKPGASLAQDRLAGDSLEADTSISHPLVRSRAASLWAGAEGMLLDSNLDQAGLPVRRDRFRTVAATLAGNAAVGGGRIRGRVALVEGLPVLDATREGDPLASRQDGSAVFTKLEFSADYRRTLAGHVSIAIAATGQLASRPLLATMEMGLGGRRFLRAYDYRELSGDNGAAGSAELRYDIGRLGPLLSRIQIYAYGDAGTVSNLRQGGGGGSLASAGGGLRLRLAKATDIGLELAVPLSTTASDPSPKPRFSTSLSQGF